MWSSVRSSVRSSALAAWQPPAALGVETGRGGCPRGETRRKRAARAVQAAGSVVGVAGRLCSHWAGRRGREWSWRDGPLATTAHLRARSTAQRHWRGGRPGHADGVYSGGSTCARHPDASIFNSRGWENVQFTGPHELNILSSDNGSSDANADNRKSGGYLPDNGVNSDSGGR